MAERTLADALAHAEEIRKSNRVPVFGVQDLARLEFATSVLKGWVELHHELVAVADEVLRLRVELEQAPERSRMAMLERIGLLKKAEK